MARHVGLLKSWYHTADGFASIFAAFCLCYKDTPPGLPGGVLLLFHLSVQNLNGGAQHTVPDVNAESSVDLPVPKMLPTGQQRRHLFPELFHFLR